MQCFKCSLQFETSNHLILHLKTDHLLKQNDYYECKNNECCRKYSSLNSYRKHLNSVHNDNVGAHENTTVCINQVVCSSNESAQNNAELKEHYCTDPKISDVSETLKLEAESLILSLYNEPHVPRKVVQLVTNSVSSLFENAIIPFIKDKVHTNLKIPEDSQKNVILEQIDDTLDSMENPFRNLNSEYKRLKMITNKYKYIAPGTYTISEVVIEKKNLWKRDCKASNCYW